MNYNFIYRISIEFEEMNKMFLKAVIIASIGSFEVGPYGKNRRLPSIPDLNRCLLKL